MPIWYIFMSPFYTLWRYIVQIYGLIAGRGSVARFAEGSGISQLVAIVIKAYCQALKEFRVVVGKRRKIWDRRRVRTGEYRDLLKKYRISATELMLRD